MATVDMDVFEWSGSGAMSDWNVNLTKLGTSQEQNSDWREFRIAFVPAYMCKSMKNVFSQQFTLYFHKNPQLHIYYVPVFT